MVSLWFGLSINEGDRSWKEPCQPSCRLQDEEEVKEKDWSREEEEKEDREMESSGSSDITNYKNIQGASFCRKHYLKSLSLAYYVLCASALLPLSPHFSSWSHCGYYWWGTSCSMFSFSLQVLSLKTPWELWTSSRTFEDSCSLVTEQCVFCTHTNLVFKGSPSPLLLLSLFDTYSYSYCISVLWHFFCDRLLILISYHEQRAITAILYQ